MNTYDARKWLILTSLSLAGVFFVFFLLAPSIGYPLRYAQAQALWQMVLPIFLVIWELQHSLFFKSEVREIIWQFRRL